MLALTAANRLSFPVGTRHNIRTTSRGLAARERQGEELDAWIVRARASENADLQRFAAGLLLDRAAVHAGLTLEWSNGQTEGQVNRLKSVKRQMYGRAGFDLLRQRVLHGA